MRSKFTNHKYNKQRIISLEYRNMTPCIRYIKKAVSKRNNIIPIKTVCNKIILMSDDIYYYSLSQFLSDD